MRLIDADAIPWTDLNDNPNSKIRVLITFADKVNKMPTIEERKKGTWIEITDHETPIACKCSECGWFTTHYDSFLFCPTCGSYNGG